MSEKETSKGVTYTFEKKQNKPKMNPFFMGVISGFLALLGIMIIVIVAMGANNPFAAVFATKTPTPTMTFTPSPSPMPSATPTITETAGPTITNTPTGPQSYIVKAGDTCWGIAQAFNVSDFNIFLYYNPTNCGAGYVAPGDVVIIPPSNAEMPTATPFPTDFPRGSQFTYTVQYGDTLQSIADKFNDDLKQLIARNKITDVNSIKAGDQLIVRWDIMTRTPTLAPTSTLNLITPKPTGTATPKP
jgi:LysM repeat protein